MKLLRVGPAGRNARRCSTRTGTLRDLSGLVADIDGALLADDAALGPDPGGGRGRGAAACWTPTGCASGRRSPVSARSCASG